MQIKKMLFQKYPDTCGRGFTYYCIVWPQEPWLFLLSLSCLNRLVLGIVVGPLGPGGANRVSPLSYAQRYYGRATFRVGLPQVPFLQST